MSRPSRKTIVSGEKGILRVGTEVKGSPVA